MASSLTANTSSVKGSSLYPRISARKFTIPKAIAGLSLKGPKFSAPKIKALKLPSIKMPKITTPKISKATKITIIKKVVKPFKKTKTL